MTKITYNPREHRMTFEGHAGAAPAGEDLVCAALTALARTLCLAADNELYHSDIRVDAERAAVDVQCRPDEDYIDACDYMFDIILGGVLLIRQHFPDYVEFKMTGGNQ